MADEDGGDRQNGAAVHAVASETTLVDNNAASSTTGAATAASHPSPHKHMTRTAKYRRLLQGVLLLVAVATIWVAAAALAQGLLKDRDCPVFLTWVNVSMFALLLPLRWARERWSCGFPCCSSGRCKTLLAQAPRSDWRAAAKAGAIVAIPWFLAQGTYNASLSGTSVSSSTVLSTTSCVFTFGLSLLFLKERFRWAKLFGVLITLAGAVMVAFSDNSQKEGTDKWWGDALALFSALCYAFYTLLIKRLVPEGEDQGGGKQQSQGETAAPPPQISTQVFFGFLGLANAVLLAPVVGVLQALKVEDSVASLPLSFIGLMLLKGLFDNVISDLLWARAIQLTSPTIATVGLSLTIPLAMLSDLILQHKTPADLMVLGSLSVAVGFLLVTVAIDDGVTKRFLVWLKRLLTCRACSSCCCHRGSAVPEEAVDDDEDKDEDEEGEEIPLAAVAPATAKADEGSGLVMTA